MEYPKLVIVSDGQRTAALLDGIFIGRGVERLELSTEDKEGRSNVTIRLLEINVAAFHAEKSPDALERMMGGLKE